MLRTWPALLLTIVMGCGTTVSLDFGDAGDDGSAPPTSVDSSSGEDAPSAEDASSVEDAPSGEDAPSAEDASSAKDAPGVFDSGAVDATTPADAAADARADVGPIDAAADAKCDGILCGNVCTAWRTDPHNCGECGRDCLGTSCVNGYCTASTLVSQYVSNRPIALDATRVYFSAQNNLGSGTGVAAVPKSGGAATLLAPNEAADGIALDDAFVYYTEHLQGLVRRVPRDGSAAPATIATGTANGLSGVGVDASYVYYTDSIAKTVYRVAKAGGSPQPIATGETEPTLLVVDASAVYFSAQGQLRRAPLDGVGGVFTLANNFYATQIAQVATDIVYINNDEVGTVPKSGGGTHPYDKLYPGLSGVAVAATSNALFYSYYYSNQGYPDEIRSSAIPSMNSGPIYYSDWTGARPMQLAVDATWIYFVAADGTLQRVAVP